MTTHWLLAAVSVCWPPIILWNRDRLRSAHLLLRVAFVAGLAAHTALALTLLAMSEGETGYALAIFSGLMGLSALALYFWRRPRTRDYF